MKLIQLNCPYCGADWCDIEPYYTEITCLSEDGSSAMFTSRHYECLVCSETFDTLLTMDMNRLAAAKALQDKEQK